MPRARPFTPASFSSPHCSPSRCAWEHPPFIKGDSEVHRNPVMAKVMLVSGRPGLNHSTRFCALNCLAPLTFKHTLFLYFFFSFPKLVSYWPYHKAIVLPTTFVRFIHVMYFRHSFKYCLVCQYWTLPNLLLRFLLINTDTVSFFSLSYG